MRAIRDKRNNAEIMKPFFKLWKQRHKAHAFVKQAAERCRVERERLLVEGPIEIFLRGHGYLLAKEALSSKAMNAFVVAHRQVLIDLDGAAYKAANRGSKAGLFAYLHDLIIDGNARRKGCWKRAPPRHSGGLELCDRQATIAN